MNFPELLSIIPDVYKSFICEAIENIDCNPEEFEPLIGGFSNAKIFKFKVDEKSYVLRIFDKEKPIEKRTSELTAHKIAADLEIAPKVHYINSEFDPLVMIMDYIDGRSFSSDDLSDKEIIKNIMYSIKKFHNHSKGVVLKKTKFDSMNENYENAIKNGVVYPSEFNEMRKKLLQKFEELNDSILPSHGDLNIDNILITADKKVFLIDWAESKSDNPLMDIGWLSCLSGATIQQTTDLLEQYLLRTPTEIDVNKAMFFQNAARFYLATYWIGKQKERDQKILDDLLECPLKVDLSKKIIDLDDKSFTKASLSWFKEFKENQYLYN